MISNEDKQAILAISSIGHVWHMFYYSSSKDVRLMASEFYKARSFFYIDVSFLPDYHTAYDIEKEITPMNISDLCRTSPLFLPNMQPNKSTSVPLDHFSLPLLIGSVYDGWYQVSMGFSPNGICVSNVIHFGVFDRDISIFSIHDMYNRFEERASVF